MFTAPPCSDHAESVGLPRNLLPHELYETHDQAKDARLGREVDFADDISEANDDFKGATLIRSLFENFGDHYRNQLVEKNLEFSLSNATMVFQAASNFASFLSRFEGVRGRFARPPHVRYLQFVDLEVGEETEK